MRPFEIDWWPKRVVCDRGAVRRLPALLSELGRKRALVVCGRSVAASPLFEMVRQELGAAFVGAHATVAMHAPLPDLVEGAKQAQEAGADIVVSLGGGSAIDSGKGVCLIDRVGRSFADYALGDVGPRRVPDLRLAHIAIPTTTGSGSEVSPTCGLRDPEAMHKRIFRDERLIPDIAVLDATVTVDAPARLTACSGMTAVARCVEALYSGRRNPFRSALALYALPMLVRSLPRSIDAPDDLDAREACLIASAMSAVAANVNTSAVHAVGHVVGGRYGLQHGVPHAILLSSGMALMSPSIGAEQISLLRALGGDEAGLGPDQAGRAAADRITALVARLPLPQRLREVGVARDDLQKLAETASHDPILVSSGANLSSDRIAGMLEAAY